MGCPSYVEDGGKSNKGNKILSLLSNKGNKILRLYMSELKSDTEVGNPV